MKRKKIVVLGYMGGCPIAGVVWQYLHYLVGLQELGHEVYYVEDTARMPYDPSRAPSCAACGPRHSKRLRSSHGEAAA